MRKIIKTLASLKFAVVIIIAIATLTAVGTFIEADYNAMVAQKWIYKSIYMYTVMGALSATLIAVIIDRYPWQKHHLGFVLAHIGIITILVGAWLTQKFGVDGSMRLQPNENQKFVTLGETNLGVYASMDGDKYRSVFSQEVDFFMDSPAKNPITVSLPNAQIQVIDYIPFATAQSKMVDSKINTDPPALRFQLENDKVNVSNWLTFRTGQPTAEMDLGPAKVVLARRAYEPTGRNEVVLTPTQDFKTLSFTIYNKEKQKIKNGTVKVGGSVVTGWMGLVFRVLDYIPNAKEDVKFTAVSRPREGVTTSAIKIKFKDQEYWVGLNSMIKLFDQNVGYILTYQNKVLDLGFPLQLERFEVGRYQGTMRAASYQSQVMVPEVGSTTISMNEPLKYKGYTFYQASFEQNEQGQPTASVLSVNHDPGRWVKYIGSLLIVAGTVIMFYFKRRRSAA